MRLAISLSRVPLIGSAQAPATAVSRRHRRTGAASRLGTAVGVGFLLFQLGAVFTQHLGPTRYFAWAPNDYVVRYRLTVREGDRELAASEILARYRHLYGVSAGATSSASVEGVYENPPQQLIDQILQYERTYGRKDHAVVTLTYRLDERAPVDWVWHG